MADKQYPRDARTGRFAKLDVLAPDLGVPGDCAYSLTGRAENDADPVYAAPDVRDDLAVGGQQRRLEPRTAVLAGDETAQERFGVQGVLTRLAARRRSTDSMDPTRFLTGAE